MKYHDTHKKYFEIEFYHENIIYMYKLCAAIKNINKSDTSCWESNSLNGDLKKVKIDFAIIKIQTTKTEKKKNYSDICGFTPQMSE